MNAALGALGGGLAAFARDVGLVYGPSQFGLWLSTWRRRRPTAGPAWGAARAAERPLELIARYHRQRRGADALDRQTSADLDLDRVFRRLDHTGSATGQQMLYHMLHTPRRRPEPLERLDRLAEHFAAAPEARAAVRRVLARLDDASALHLPGLFTARAPGGRARRFLPFLSLAFVLSLAAPPLWGGLAFLFPLTLALANLGFGSWWRPRLNDLVPADNLAYLLKYDS